MSNESYVKAILDGTADKEVIFDRLSDMAMDAMNSVSSIDELSKSTLGQYVRIASTDAVKHTHDSASAIGKKTQAEKKELFKKAMKRLDGVRSASYKLAKESEG